MNCIDLLFMFGKHRLQKPTRFAGLQTKWRVSPKTDEIVGNSGTATAVPVVLRAAPLHTPKCAPALCDKENDYCGALLSIILLQ